MKMECFIMTKGIRLARLEVVVMPNDEIICAGKHIGWMDEKAKSWRGRKTLGDFIEEIELAPQGETSASQSKIDQGEGEV